jgi:hypothetical protein
MRPLGEKIKKKTEHSSRISEVSFDFHFSSSSSFLGRHSDRRVRGNNIKLDTHWVRREREREREISVRSKSTVSILCVESRNALTARYRIRESNASDVDTR